MKFLLKNSYMCTEGWSSGFIFLCLKGKQGEGSSPTCWPRRETLRHRLRWKRWWSRQTGTRGRTWPTCVRRLPWVPSEVWTLTPSIPWRPARSLHSDPTSILNLPNQVRPIEAVDFVPALRQVKASVSRDDLDTYLKWNTQYGATG